MKACLEGSTSRAFADDIGTIIPQLLQLQALPDSFKIFERVSGLVLEPKKCVIVLLGRRIDAERIKAVKEYVCKVIPEWAAFDVRDCAEYLGLIVGAGGGNDTSWEKPLKHFRSRTSEIAKSELAPSIRVDFYSQRAVPTTSYVPQLCEITPKVEKEELLALQRVFHLSHHAFPKNSSTTCWKVGFARSYRLK